MLLLRNNTNEALEPDVWSASAELDAGAADVLEALTDPELIAEWAPVSFEIEGASAQPLRAGSHERVSGSIAGLTTRFDVEVARADTRRLELSARGPLSLDVAYAFRARGSRVLVEAHVAVHRRGGMRAHVLRAAVAALLRAGALDCALGHLGDCVSERCEPALLAA